MINHVGNGINRCRVCNLDTCLGSAYDAHVLSTASLRDRGPLPESGSDCHGHQLLSDRIGSSTLAVTDRGLEPALLRHLSSIECQ